MKALTQTACRTALATSLLLPTLGDAVAAGTGLGAEIPVPLEGASEVSHAAIAYDETNDLYLMVWAEARYEAGPYEIVVQGQRLAPSGQSIGDRVLLFDGLQEFHSLEVSNVNATDCFLVVCGSEALRVRASDGQYSKRTDIGFIAHSIGGDRTLEGDEVVAVGRYAPVQMQRIQVPPTGSPTLVGAPMTMATEDLEDLRITSAGGPQGRRMVAGYQHAASAIVAWSVGRDLLPDSEPATLSSDFYPYDWSVAGDGTQLLMAVVGESAESPGIEARAYGVRLEDGQLAPDSFATLAEDLDWMNHMDVAVGFTGSSFLVVHPYRYAFTGQHSVRLSQVEPEACDSCVKNVGEIPVEGYAFAMRSIGVDPASSGRAVVTHSDGYELDIQPLGVTSGGAVTPQVVAGCGQGGELSLTGHVAVGGEVTFSLEGADPAAYAGRLAFNPADLFLESGDCTLLVWHASDAMRVSTAPVGGDDEVTLTLPNESFLAGLKLNAQWMTFGGADSPWITPNSSVSNVIDFTIAE